MKKRHRFLVVFSLALVSIIGLAAYNAYSAFYNHIMEKSEAWHLKVEEVNGTHPLQLRIMIDPLGSAPIIRGVSVKTHGAEMTIMYHLALSGLAKPNLTWGEVYVLTVPDSVKDVRFGRSNELIWQRLDTGRVMSYDRLERLRSGITRIQLGDSIELAKQSIGEPDTEYSAGPKRPHPIEDDLNEVDYYVSLVSQAPGNIHDKVVALSFNHRGRLVSIRSNVDGVASRCCGSRQ